MECEHATAPRIGVTIVGKVGLHAGGRIAKGERVVPGQGAEHFWQALTVLDCLWLDAAEGRPRRLGFHHADGPAPRKEHIVHLAGGQRKLANSHAKSSGAVHPLARLHLPAGGLEHLVDLLTRFLFRG
jgi:hypothetical protein